MIAIAVALIVALIGCAILSDKPRHHGLTGRDWFAGTLIVAGVMWVVVAGIGMSPL